jgi:hypothetical protein
MVFMSKIHQFFQHLANFSQNSLNNKIIKQVEDDLLPKDIPAFVKSLFVKQTAGGIITLTTTNTNAKNQEGAAVSGEGNKHKSDGNEPG